MKQNHLLRPTAGETPGRGTQWGRKLHISEEEDELDDIVKDVPFKSSADGGDIFDRMVNVSREGSNSSGLAALMNIVGWVNIVFLTLDAIVFAFRINHLYMNVSKMIACGGDKLVILKSADIMGSGGIGSGGEDNINVLQSFLNGQIADQELIGQNNHCTNNGSDNVDVLTSVHDGNRMFPLNKLNSQDLSVSYTVIANNKEFAIPDGRADGRADVRTDVPSENPHRIDNGGKRNCHVPIPLGKNTTTLQDAKTLKKVNVKIMWTRYWREFRSSFIGSSASLAAGTIVCLQTAVSSANWLLPRILPNLYGTCVTIKTLQNHAHVIDGHVAVSAGAYTAHLFNWSRVHVLAEFKQYQGLVDFFNAGTFQTTFNYFFN